MNSFRGIPIKGAEIGDIEPNPQPPALDDLHNLQGEWWIHPRAVASLCRVSEDEACAWLEKNATLQEGCWVIRGKR